jgi:two-component system response regulator AlgR
MKILIADDEKLARLRLKSLINEITTEDVQIVAEAENGRVALQKWQETGADILLLDVRMPDMDGLSVAREVAKIKSPPAIIFTTAYDEHALQAFDANAIDYLLKPIRKERLLNALQKAQVFNRAKWDDLKQWLPENSARSHLCVQVQAGLHLVPIKDVVFFQADQKYVIVKTPEKAYLLDESLKALEDEFAGLFIRIHRNTLVSLRHIEVLQRQRDGRLSIQCLGIDEKLIVSRRLAAKVRSCFKEFKVNKTPLR